MRPATDSKLALADNLIALLASRPDKSRMEHARLMGVGDGTLGRIIYGTGNPGVEILDAIAAYFRTQPWELLKPAGKARGVAEPPSQSLSGEALMVASDLVDEALQGLWLPRLKRFELVSLALDGITQGLPYAEILEFVSPAARKLANAETEHGSESGMGGAGPKNHGRRKAAM